MDSNWTMWGDCKVVKFRLVTAMHCNGPLPQVITELNSQKDQLNKLGSLHFATETNQTLTDFFSDDELGEDIDPSTLSSVRKKKIKNLYQVQKNI